MMEGGYDVAVGDFLVRRAEAGDVEEVAARCHSRWPSVEEHAREVAPLMAGKAPGKLPAIIFVAEGATGGLAGVIEGR